MVPNLSQHEFSCSALAARLQGAPGSHSQDTAAGSSPTWPPASGSVDCTLYITLPEDFSSMHPQSRGSLQVTPRGLSEMGAAGQLHLALRAFSIPTLDSLGSPRRWTLLATAVPARPAQRAARLATWSWPDLMLHVPRRNGMPGEILISDSLGPFHFNLACCDTDSEEKTYPRYK